MKKKAETALLHIYFIGIFLGWSYIAYEAGRYRGNAEGWRERTEYHDSSSLPTHSQIERLIEAM